MVQPRGVFRTIQHGQVDIFGRTYVPNEHHYKYSGQLDGQRWFFGLYWGPPNYGKYDARGLASFVSLWGTEAAAKAKTLEDMKGHWPGPNCIDGYFRWEWWDTNDTTKKISLPDRLSPLHI